MTQEKPQEKREGPPDWLFKNIINPTMKTILRSPFHGLLSNGLAIITFTGRKSGKIYRTPVAYHVESDNVVYVFTRSPWWKNLTDATSINLRIKGKNRQFKPEIIQDNARVWEIISHYIEHYDGNYRRVGVMMSEGASEAEIRTAVSDMLAIRLTAQ